MSDYVHLIDTVQDDDVENNGIFSFIRNSLEKVPEYLTDIVSLNLGYYYQHSGEKIVSPLVKHYLDDSNKLTSDSLYKISRILIDACKVNWDREYQALTAEYSPIENVDAYLTETTDRTGNGTHSETETDTGTDDHSKTGTETLKQEGTDTFKKTGDDRTEGKTDKTDYHHEYTSDVSSNPGGTSETVNGLAGFNSDEYSKDTKSTTTVKQEVTTIHRTLSVETDKDGNPKLDDDGNQIERPGKNSDESHETGSDKTTYNNTTAETVDKTDTTTYNIDDNETLDLQHSRNGSESSTGKEDHTLHRHGNIGITTNQQMITEELELRKVNFYDILFRDVDRYLTLTIY